MLVNGMKIVVLVSGLICLSCSQDPEAKCSTPDGGVGLCKHYSNCPQLMDLVSKKRYSPETLSFVKNRICRDLNEVSICCNDCYTPDGKAGLCTPYRDCPHILEMLQTGNRTSYAYNSICKHETMEVCCGPPPEPLVKGDCKDSAFPPDAESECCGIERTFESKIVGGNSTNIDQYPWLVLLEYEDRGFTKLKCGGSLISNRYVLTAAHCVTGKRARGLKNVRLGEYNISHEGPDCIYEDCTDGPISIRIEEAIPHPEYNSTTVWNDIAVLRLAENVKFNDFIQPICLPWSDVTEEQELSRLRAWAAGWGQVTNSTRNTQSSDVKMHVALPLVDMKACLNSYRKQKTELKYLWSNQLCAGGEFGKDSCKGDSGGPLMLERRLPNDGRTAYELIGIISFGPTACGTQNLPGIYTKVHEYNHWIRSVLRPEKAPDTVMPESRSALQKLLTEMINPSAKKNSSQPLDFDIFLFLLLLGLFITCF